MSATVYILGDADKVRQRVEGALLAHDFDGLAKFSADLTAAVSLIARRTVEILSAEIVMAGGDDLLLVTSADQFDSDALGRLARSFADETGCTISFGVGSTVEEAYLRLRRAKASGGGAISVGSLA